MGGVLRAGLIGSSIQNTRLPAALEIMCADAGLSLEFELVDTAGRHGFDFDAEVRTLVDKGWHGVSVTHPHKISAAKLAGDGMTQASKHLGASNLLMFDQAGFAGHNTDYSGFLAAWRTEMQPFGLSPGTVAVAGAGGVAQALVPALVELGAARVDIWDLDADKALALASQCGSKARAVATNDASEVAMTADGLVNATALGMHGYPGTAFDPSWLGGQSWAFDAVYTPTQTEFLKCASGAGLKCLSGFELFRHMAIATFQAYTGLTVDETSTLTQLNALKPD